jgi:hypothetical protein
MMKTKLVAQLCYDNACEHAEDYELWERAARSGWKMTNVPEVLLFYRQHSTQISFRSSCQQHQLMRIIQRRYWPYYFTLMQLPQDWIDEVIKIREPSPPKPNMDNVDSVFNELLLCNYGESREIIFNHAKRLYFRVAAVCPDVVARWVKLNNKFGNKVAIGTKIGLWLLSVLHIRSNSAIFHNLKKIYFYTRS